MLFFFLPGWIRPNSVGVLFVVTLDICPHLWIVGFPVVQMTNKQVMISPSDFAKRNQIVRIKLQLRIKVEGLDMMDLQSPALMTTHHASGFAREMRVRYGWPLWTTLLVSIFTRYRQPMIARFRACPPLCWEWTAPGRFPGARRGRFLLSPMPQVHKARENDHNDKHYQDFCQRRCWYRDMHIFPPMFQAINSYLLIPANRTITMKCTS